MGLADQIFSQMNTIGEPLRSTSTTTTTPPQPPIDIGSMGLLLMLMMMNQGKSPVGVEGLPPMGMGQEAPNFGLMGMGGQPTGTAGNAGLLPMLMQLMRG